MGIHTLLYGRTIIAFLCKFSKYHVKLMSNDHVAKNCNPSQDGQFAITQTTSAVKVHTEKGNILHIHTYFKLLL